MNLGAPELLIIFLGLLPLVFVAWALVDAASRPEWVWQRANQNRVLWIVLLAVGLFFCGIGVVLALVYAVAIRPQLVRETSGGGPL